MVKHNQSVQRTRTHGAYATCTAMSGSGVQTGMIKATMLIRQGSIHVVRMRARTGCAGAGAGSAPPGIAGPRTVSGSPRRTGSTTWAFVSP